MSFKTIDALKQVLDDLEDAKKSKDLLREMLSLWDDSFEEYHYKAVADHQNSYHHKTMLELLKNIKKHLEQ